MGAEKVTGKWVVDGERVVCDGELICIAGSHEHACLIAMAPDMMVALESCLRVILERSRGSE